LVTATPEAMFDEVSLAIATQYGAKLPNGGRTFRQFVLRNDGGEWESVELSSFPADEGVNGVTFTSSRSDPAAKRRMA
jgi:hypothetical protein